ncbi:hypothetical protein DFH09DRAFT_1186925 [Mycena vulgaris]|nr:hypothetical protein DFH09DRAFT_1186925 [Mycena vulgaris]
MTTAEIQARMGTAAEGNHPRSDVEIEPAQLFFLQDLKGPEGIDMNTYLDAGLERSDLLDALEEGECAAFEKCGDGCAVGEGVAEARFAEVRDFELEAAGRGQKLVIPGHNLSRVDVHVGEHAGLEGLEIDGLGVGDGGDQDAREAHRGCVVDGAQCQGKGEAHEEDLARGAGRQRGGGEEGKGGFTEAGHFWTFNVVECSYQKTRLLNS